MAMVKITNGKIITEVSQKTYENKFRPNGWRELSQKRRQREDRQQGPDDITEEYAEDIDTIPISDMNGEQLKEYATKHKIDTSGASTVAEARKIIQSAVRKKNM